MKHQLERLFPWSYLTYVRENKIANWKNTTEIIYGDRDNLTERDVIDSFVRNYGANLTVVENGEHYLQSIDEVQKLDDWLKCCAD